MADTLSIDNQIWDSFNSISRETAEEKQLQKNGEAKIAAANRPMSKEQVALDLVVPAAKGEVPKAPAQQEDIPSLPSPSTIWKGIEDSKEQGLISLIGAVLALQAKTNSNFWSNLWKQATQSMMAQVKFAPIIGDAVRESYDAQAAATEADATQAFATAFIDLGSFVAAVGTAGAMEYKNPELPASQDENVFAAPKLPEEGQEAADASLENAPQGATQEELNEQLTNNDQWAEQTKRVGGKILTEANQKRMSLTGLMFKLSGVSASYSMLSQGTTAGVTSHYQGVKADAQGRAGQASAIEKESEQYAQFYGQSFSRTDTLNQASQQFIDSAMGILKSAADSLTQVITSMFRG